MSASTAAAQVFPWVISRYSSTHVNQMVLERAFDNLMEEVVWGEYLMDISSREGGGEWLVQKIT